MKNLAFFCLLSLAIVYAAIEPSSISVVSSYKQGRIRFEVTGVNKEDLSGSQMIVARDDEPSMNSVFKNGGYEVSTVLPVGITEFDVRVSDFSS